MRRHTFASYRDRVPVTRTGHPSKETIVPTKQQETTLDRATAEHLATAFNRCFESRDAGDDLFAADAFFDLHPPFWRFQLQGAEALALQLRAIAEGASSSARVLRVVPTATGFVMEHEETSHKATVEVARRLWLCEVVDGRIAHAVGYCNGGWDDALRERHAAEAPMLRP